MVAAPLGVLWIAVMTWICYVGIEASAKTQWFLLGAEVVILGIFAVVALGKVYFVRPGRSDHSVAFLDQSVRHQEQCRVGRRDHPGGVHLLGLG